MKLKIALARAGFLQPFLDLLGDIEVAPGYSASEAFADAVNLSEGHPAFAQVVAAASEALGVTQAQVDEILSASVAD